MEYVWEFSDGPFDVVVTQSGVASAREMLTNRARFLADPRIKPGMNLLMDITQLDVQSVDTDGIRMLAEPDRQWEEAAFRSAVIVASTPVKYGLSRMFENLASGQLDLAEHFAVVTSVAEAVEWLAALPSAATE